MPQTTLDKIVQSKRMPVLFIGSGISKRYLYRYPDWNELLTLSYRKINDDPFQLQKYKDQLVRQGLTDFEVNTKLATIIENQFNEAFFDRKIKLDRVKNPKWVQRGTSPYKMFLSKFFKNMTIYHSEKTNDEIAKFRALKNKISAVITTNYDLFLEKHIFSTDFKVFVHQNELFSSDSYNIAEIYKIHGSVSDADSIVITDSDYSRFAESRKLIIAKMLTLFAESPIIFLGYSFTDENVQLIISEFLGCLTSRELDHIDEHFIFISYKKNENDLKEIKRTITTKNGVDIPITEIQTDNYSLVYDILNRITPGISPIRIRETRKIVKTIVDQSVASADASSIIVGLDDLSNIDLSNKPLAVAIGYRESILNKYGYGMLADDMIFEDILLGNKHFDPNNMCLERFKSIPYNRLLPVFKYVASATENITVNEKLQIYISTHDTKDKIIPSNIKKQVNSLPVINEYEQLLAEINTIPDVNKKAGILLKNLDSFSVDQIRDICIQLFQYDRTSSMRSTHFKRCVMYIDLLENHIN
ncbi:MAG: SIR2 family protein [Lachnospiraceae bacterium]|nr:SIR2 family protein [Lachnospiraceae bacterium]